MAVKVSQATIDKIKKMGMTKALSGIKSTSGAEYKEAVRRMYGQKRLDAALGKGGATYKSADAARSGSTKTGTKPKYTTPDAARAASVSLRGGSASAAYKAGKSTGTKTTSSTASKSTTYVVGARDPRVNATNAVEAISKGTGKKVTFGKGGYITNRSGTYIDVRANASRARTETTKPKTPAQLAAEKAKKAAAKAAAEQAARLRSPNRGYTNR